MISAKRVEEGNGLCLGMAGNVRGSTTRRHPCPYAHPHCFGRHCYSPYVLPDLSLSPSARDPSTSCAMPSVAEDLGDARVSSPSHALSSSLPACPSLYLDMFASLQMRLLPPHACQLRRDSYLDMLASLQKGTLTLTWVYGERAG